GVPRPAWWPYPERCGNGHRVGIWARAGVLETVPLRGRPDAASGPGHLGTLHGRLPGIGVPVGVVWTRRTRLAREREARRHERPGRDASNDGTWPSRHASPTGPLSVLPSAGRRKIWVRLPGRANGKHSSLTCERHENAAKVGEVGSVRFCLQIAGDG